jgi:hypothetical protein
MNLIYVRSPYLIKVNETGQTGAKVKIYLWSDGGAEPATPNYTLSKDIPSTTQLELSFNISNYVREYINNLSPYPDRSAIVGEYSSMWCNVTIKKYKIVSGVDTLISSTSYIGVNGYTKYTDGLNASTISDFIALSDDAKTIYYNRSKPYPYINLLFDNTSGTKALKIRQVPKTGAAIDTIYTTTSFYNLVVPVTSSLTRFEDESTLQIIDNITAVKLYSFKVVPVCEPKYTPVVCSYINRKGGWQFLTFFKAQTNTISTKGSTYKMMPSQLDYSISQAQTKSFNINGQQSIKLNTGWVDENYSDLITDLLLSETILLDDKPVELKTSSTDLKTSLKDKMINYEIEFDYAFNLINDVV